MPPRPNRKACAILFSALVVTTIVVLCTRPEQPRLHRVASSGLLSYPFTSLFSFRAPAALFVPTATISLTDDNSTYFAARPAAFGPLLPAHGLSGQLWIGHGFGADDHGRPGLITSDEGQLGCEDIPGWSDGDWHRRHTTTPGHDDIARVHEPAPIDRSIAGKVVLLSRGGCSFTAKVEWAQRRGAKAVIVGDNIIGSPLVHMYPQGDTTNITIPSLFTSHTTAHLLSSLIPAGSAASRSLKPRPDFSAKAGRSAQNSRGEHPADKSMTDKSMSMWSREMGWRLGFHRSARWPSSAALERAGKTPSAMYQARDQARDMARHGLGDSASVVHRTPDGLAKTARERPHGESFDQHQGLWVTLTPTNMSAGPFLNTLFVLVVSPLITLAVIYTMLLFRSRIRRRRWRAPKSIVERLPVRIYHALSTSASSSNSVQQTEASTALPTQTQATTPLLAESEPSASASAPLASHYGSIEPAHAETEKTETGLAAWKRKYEGRQVECVVCLEEYEDGVSKVMSLPCGHEFHVDCITPWLTTRRRTCPICKGDVVRSLIHDDSSGASSSGGSFDDVQAQAAQTVNNSPSAAMPVPALPATAFPDEDVEEGLHQQGSLNTWYDSVQRRIDAIIASLSLPGSDARRPQPSENDNDRR